MRLDIQYRMRFDYESPVWESQNELRVRPRSDERQQVIARRLTTAPTSRVLSFVDYWGTTVDHVGVREPHLAFEIVAEAAVETMAQPELTVDPPLSTLRESSFTLPLAEYLASSSHTAWTDDIADLARESVRGAATVGEEIRAVVDAVRSTITYQPGTTDIGISLHELVNGGTGVCQDYAHLTIGMLRSLGLPARYVSGYLFAANEADLTDVTEDHVVYVQTHAWVEVNIPGHGWHGIDPTNNYPVVDKHVVIGHGRDYDDVAPVRGVVVGDTIAEVEAEVKIERMAPAAQSVITDGPRRLDSIELARVRQRMFEQQQQ